MYVIIYYFIIKYHHERLLHHNRGAKCTLPELYIQPNVCQENIYRCIKHFISFVRNVVGLKRVLAPIKLVKCRLND
jgi:hypothetical protein